LLVKSGPETAATPREYLESLYANSSIVVPDWMLKRQPEKDNRQEWTTFGEFLPALTLHIFKHLVNNKPGRLVACARSGIPLGTAVEAISQAFNVPIPADDEQVHAYKITASPSTTHAVQLAHIKDIVLEAETLGGRR
jgi:hypothetical protein